MSDDTPVGSVSLEDDAPPAPVAVAEPPVPVEAAPPAPVEIDENTVQPADLVDQGKATGLIGALKAVRGEARATKQENEQLRAQLAQATAVVQAIQQLRQQAAPEPAAPSADPLAVQLAGELDIYTQDGKPDPVRGAKVAETIRTLAAGLVEQQLAPMRDQQARAASLENFQRTVNTTATNGLKPSVESLTTLWQTLPVQYTANPQIAQTLWTIALGMDATGTKARVPQPPLPAPVVSEPVGGGPPRTQKPLTAGEQMVISQRGMTEAKYRTLTADYKPGRASVLEDD